MRPTPDPSGWPFKVPEEIICFPPGIHDGNDPTLLDRFTHVVLHKSQYLAMKAVCVAAMELRQHGLSEPSDEGGHFQKLLGASWDSVDALLAELDVHRGVASISDT